MAFLTYKCFSEGANLRFEYAHPLRLAGPDGPIARHMRHLGPLNAAQEWQLSAAALANLAGLTDGQSEYAILMELYPNTAEAVCFYQLRQILGICRDYSTHLLFEFAGLVNDTAPSQPAQFKAAFTIPAERPLKLVHETLLLSGGLRGGNWKWRSPMLNLGSAVVAPCPLKWHDPQEVGSGTFEPVIANY